MRNGVHKVEKEYAGRVHFMDFARGVIIIGVVIYHALFDMVYVFRFFSSPIFEWPIVTFIRDFGAGLLIFMSGIACHLSRNNLKRGLICLGVAVGMSLFTWFLMNDEFIYFGVLHFFAIAMIGYGLLKKAVDKLPTWMAAVFFVLFLVTFGIPYYNHIGIYTWGIYKLPESFSTSNYVLHSIGVPAIAGAGYGAGNVFRLSADYFPIIPWIFLFLTGNCLGHFVKEGRIPKWLYVNPCKPISFIGTKTLYIYVAHQPVVYGILLLIYKIMNKSA